MASSTQQRERKKKSYSYTKLLIDSLRVVSIKKVNMKPHVLKLLLLHMACASPRHNPTNQQVKSNDKCFNIELT